jgi:hypothetical protein
VDFSTAAEKLLKLRNCGVLTSPAVAKPQGILYPNTHTLGPTNLFGKIKKTLEDSVTILFIHKKKCMKHWAVSISDNKLPDR